VRVSGEILRPDCIGTQNDKRKSSGIGPGKIWMRQWVLRLVCRGVFVHNGSMLSIILKALYIVLLIVLWYLNIAFTAIASFLKVTFFGL
jgi:hypothetical protein